MRLRGLYAITDGVPRLLERVAAAIVGGATVVQYRDKSADNAYREREARDLLAVCRAHGVPLIINDDVALAATIGADGVHLGRDDTALREARRALGDAAIIGVSCYNDFDRAVAAQQAGASYVAFGRFFASHTKPDAAPANLDLIHQAKAQLSIPVVAIGGITPDNAAPLIDAGVDMLAVVHGIFGQADPEQAARRYTQLFEHLRNQP
jgi:thiamine-phosphate pyrophosphorylase